MQGLGQNLVEAGGGARWLPQPEAEPEPEAADQDADEEDLEGAHLTPRQRVRRSMQRRRERNAARLAATRDRVQDGLAEIGDNPRSRQLFALWLALLMTFLLGFVVLLIVDIDQWASGTDGVIMDDGGNVDDPVGHCDPAHGRCGCYHEVPFADSWIDAQTLGRGHMLGDDDFFTVRLPFPFEFFGRRFEGDSQLIMVSSNGYFTFGSTHYKYGNTQTIPHDGVPDEMAAVYWSDFDPSAGRTQAGAGWTERPHTPHVFTYHRRAVDEPRLLPGAPRQPGAFVVEWAQIAHFNDPRSTCTFEAIMYDDGNLSFLYADISPTPNNWAAPSVGFEDARGAAGVQIAFNDPEWPPIPEAGGGYALSIPPSCHEPEPEPEPEPDPQPAPKAHCKDHGEVTLRGRKINYCDTVRLMGMCSEQSEDLADLVMNPEFEGQLAWEVCPRTCNACAAEAAAEAIEAKVRCPPTEHDTANTRGGCDQWQDCWVISGLAGCECKPGLVEDDCGRCSIPPFAAPGSFATPQTAHGAHLSATTGGGHQVWGPGGTFAHAFNEGMDCAGQCNGDAYVDSCGSCVGGITEKVEGENLGCDGKCFTSKQCDDVYWPPIIMLLSATCIGFSMIIVVSGLRRRLFWRMVAERERAEGLHRRRHGQRTEELLASLATVVYDPDKEDMLQELGLEATAELGTCSICLGEYEEGDEMMALPDCSHVFHADCMSSWLRVRHTCPLCVRRVRAPPGGAGPAQRQNADAAAGQQQEGQQQPEGEGARDPQGPQEEPEAILAALAALGDDDTPPAPSPGAARLSSGGGGGGGGGGSDGGFGASPPSRGFGLSGGLLWGAAAGGGSTWEQGRELAARIQAAEELAEADAEAEAGRVDTSINPLSGGVG